MDVWREGAKLRWTDGRTHRQAGRQAGEAGAQMDLWAERQPYKTGPTHSKREDSPRCGWGREGLGGNAVWGRFSVQYYMEWAMVADKA